jgi:ribose 5-phosphate isomerase B
MQTIVFASDHAGYDLKEKLKAQLDGYKILDLGTNSTASVDYPDFGKAAADAIASGKAELGVVICGSGIGISIAANRNPKIRCALCSDVESAKLSRQHNDANMLALGARLVKADDAEKIVKAFLTTRFEGGRHQARVDKLGA